MTSTAQGPAAKPSTTPAQGTDGPADVARSQKIVHRAFLCGVGVGFLQMLLCGAALGVVLDLLQRGTLVTPAAVVLPMICLAVYALALSSMTHLGKHQRFRSWLPALCYLAGLALSTALVLLDRTEYVGQGGLRGFFLQPQANLPVVKVYGEHSPLMVAAVGLEAAGLLSALPLFSILRIYTHAGSRRLLKWRSLA